jgi:16S rRNA (adenine1518-N6/adenine1519-N6)-dimethyltransferase
MGRPKRRRLGQNFLIDRNVAERIAASLPSEPQRVLEIGPGRGALTEPLLARFARVLALEIDADLVPALVQRFSGPRFEVRNEDALGVDLDSLLAAESPWQVAANLPYSVGTAIVRRLMPRHDLFSCIVVMLQREVARRVVARPGDRQHGVMALERAAWAEARLLFDVPPRAFRPVPRVISSVVVLELRPPSFEPDLIRRALDLAGRAMTRPRKMLRNALAPFPTVEVVAAAGLDPAARPGTLALADWVELARRTASA